MNILFLTLSNINSLTDRGIYIDLLRYSASQGHSVTIVTPKERRYKTATNLRKDNGVQILQVKTLNIQKTNFIEKGLGTLAIEYQYLAAIKKYLHNTSFDLIIYSTPPITFTKVIKEIKRRDNAQSYLLLKDIFPQNAVDLGIINKGVLYRFFRWKEKQLYKVSDFIGCMSPANVNYMLKHNQEIAAERVEVCPNSIEPTEGEVNKDNTFRIKFNIPIEATLFIYGGNLGKPQGLDFLADVLGSNNNKSDRFFIIIGSGTEKPKLAKWFKSRQITNAILLDSLPKESYDQMLWACDVGLIFLDKRFTIPNYPSRLLSYLENKMPVLIASDISTDVGTIAEENGYGLWAEHGDIAKFNQHLDKLCADETLRRQMGENGHRYLMQNYTVENSYNIIMKHFEDINS